jgi:GNAT superfamily N-acetyltransferase
MSRMGAENEQRLSLLAPEDTAAVFDLFSRCAEFFLLQDGEPPTIWDAEELFTDVPASKQPEDQHIFGVWRQGRLDALAALLTDYPEPGDWYLGLLLVDPGLRQCGLGRQIYEWLDQWAADRGARRMRLGVLRDNGAALAFWHALGFRTLRTVGPRSFKGKTHLLDELARDCIRSLPATP